MNAKPCTKELDVKTPVTMEELLNVLLPRQDLWSCGLSGLVRSNFRKTKLFVVHSCCLERGEPYPVTCDQWNEVMNDVCHVGA